VFTVIDDNQLNDSLSEFIVYESAKGGGPDVTANDMPTFVQTSGNITYNGMDDTEDGDGGYFTDANNLLFGENVFNDDLAPAGLAYTLNVVNGQLQLGETKSK
jgi:hypothetical protein